jgi:uncharacterized membrane protein
VEGAPPPVPGPGDAGAPPPVPPPLGRRETDEKILRVLCYVGLLALVPYLVSRDAEPLRFHARQGLALALLGIGCVGLALVPYIGFIGQVGLAGVLALSIVGIVKALEGSRWRMPVAAELADRFQL